MGSRKELKERRVESDRLHSRRAKLPPMDAAGERLRISSMEKGFIRSDRVGWMEHTPYTKEKILDQA